jgi:hypothetical protein
MVHLGFGSCFEGGVGRHYILNYMLLLPATYSIRDGQEGLSLRFARPADYDKAKTGRGSEAALTTFLRMRMLAECGEAEASEVDGGIFLPSADAVRLDEESREAFGLPPTLPDYLLLETQRYPQHPQFSASLVLVRANGTQFSYWKMRGPLLEAAGECFLMTEGQYAAMRIFSDWRDCERRDERSNLTMLAGLRDAWRRGCLIDLGTYQEWPVEIATNLAVKVENDTEAGGLTLGLELETAAGRVTASQMAKREHQFAENEKVGIIRAGVQGKLTVVLTEQQTLQARRILRNRHVPAAEKEAFLKNPSRWLAEEVLCGVLGEFSLRVLGLEYWTQLGLGPQSPSDIDWMVQSPEAEKTHKNKPGGEPGREPGDDNGGRTDPVVAEIADNIRTEYGRQVPALGETVVAPFEPDFSRYARSPKPHQAEAVRLLLAHAARSWFYEQTGGGAMLADDMGLGKTYSTLVFLGEWLRHRRSLDGKEPAAVLIVAPLTLIQNWQEEIGKAYPNTAVVFHRIVELHPDKDLHLFRDSNRVKDETVEDSEGKPKLKTPALIYGRGSVQCLDMPGTLVLVTYETMRQFNLSLAQCQWSVVIFDEAQALKNPNAIQTITAKSLRARFRLVMTGTPIENELRDFWCLFDTAEPGLLKTWGEFQKSYVKPLFAQTETVYEVLERLRNTVGHLMLRRMKVDYLEGLPKKHIILHPREGSEDFDPRVASVMSGDQLKAYNEARGAGIQSVSGACTGLERKRQFFSALYHMREATLHPALIGGGHLAVGRNDREAVAILQASAKLKKLLEILAHIQSKREKVLIFAINKRLQTGLAANLSRLYEIEIPIINGDTATNSKTNTKLTRMGLLSAFEQAPGFGIAILSPIAAGVGLTITAANHVIHLERHWNPAKEAQATDRVYRMGQERDVHVWIPILEHPSLVSYDKNLNRLLEKKAALNHALSIPEEVVCEDIFTDVFGVETDDVAPASPLTMEDVAGLSGYLFEALVAELFAAAGAGRVILTPLGSDHGCDVAILDAYGMPGENWLIQCKHTVQRELKGDMPVREVVGSRWHYETHLGLKFSKLAVISTARKFDRRSRHAASGQSVELLGEAWIKEQMQTCHVSMAALLQRHARRQPVG